MAVGGGGGGGGSSGNGMEPTSTPNDPFMAPPEVKVGVDGWEKVVRVVLLLVDEVVDGGGGGGGGVPTERLWDKFWFWYETELLETAAF